MDGVINVEPQNAYITIAIPFADIAEMKMETNNPTAEYGTFGGTVSRVLRLGFTLHLSSRPHSGRVYKPAGRLWRLLGSE